MPRTLQSRIINYDDETVHLVLDLLFQCMYRQPQPPVCPGLAEGAEKYVVYSTLQLPAITIQLKCIPRLPRQSILIQTLHREHMKQHPFEVLNFAVKHGHRELGNDPAWLTVGSRRRSTTTGRQEQGKRFPPRLLEDTIMALSLPNTLIRGIHWVLNPTSSSSYPSNSCRWPELTLLQTLFKL
jgi:hypothetical protein